MVPYPYITQFYGVSIKKSLFTSKNTLHLPLQSILGNGIIAS